MRRSLFLVLATVFCVVKLDSPAIADLAAAGATSLVSVSNDGRQGNGDSGQGSISADGRYVAFASDASTLMPGIPGGQVYLRDRLSGTTSLVSQSTQGNPGNRRSSDPAISADGRHVAFASSSTNLEPGLVLGVTNVFVRDLDTGVTSRESVGLDDSGANGSSTSPSLSADGRMVAFYSLGSNLVSGDRNGTWDAFVRNRAIDGSTTFDRAGNTLTERASVSSDGGDANGPSYDPFGPPTLSSDGTLVAFVSRAANLVGAPPVDVALVYVRDRLRGRTEVASVGARAADADSSQPTMSADGRYIAFSSEATNLTDVPVQGGSFDVNVFWRDRQSGTTEIVSGVPDSSGAGSSDPAITADGHRVAFFSAEDQFSAGQVNPMGNVYLWDETTGHRTLESGDPAGAPGLGQSRAPSVSGDGRFIAFESRASDLVVGDTNHASDIFVRDLNGPCSVSCLGAP